MIATRSPEDGPPAGVRRSLCSRFRTRSYENVLLLKAIARRRGVIASTRRTLDILRDGGLPALATKFRTLARRETHPQAATQHATAGVAASRIRTRGPSALFLVLAVVRRLGVVSAAWRTAHTLRSGGLPAVVSKLRNLARIERSISVGGMRSKSSSDLDQDFGMDHARWERLLSQHAQALPEECVPTVWVLVTGEAGSPKLTETCLSITEAGLAVRAIEIAGEGEFSRCLMALLVRADDRDLVWFMQAGDRVDNRAHAILARAARSEADLCLFDTYFVEGNRAFPQLHPGFNEIFGLNCNYFRSRFLARAGALRRVAEGASLTDAYLTARALLALRLRGEAISGFHLPSAFVRIQDSRAAIAQESQELIARSDAQFGGNGSAGETRPDRRVSVIICTRDKGHLLRQMVRGIMETARDFIEEIVVVSNATRNPYALKTLADLRRQQIRVVDYEGPFNFARQCNLAARKTVAPFLLFLNDDIVPVTPDWLARLLAPFDNSSVGMTGPLLLYSDETVQHAGMFLGYNNVAGHVLRSAHLPDGDYLFMTQAPREVSCLTGAALVMKRDMFDDLNGFDPTLGTSIQDVDLSLRVNRSGRRLIFNPQSILLHIESASLRRGLEDPGLQATREREHAYFLRRWGNALEQDPFHNPNFDPNAEDLRSLRPRAS
jgi:GT2 family glycosyltransferase